jgi:basic amino acid/polyamine antiporter, APA family
MSFMLKKKDVSSILNANKVSSVQKHLGAFDVTLMSIGATIGTGVMVLTGLVASRDAGPAVVLSFIISSIVCILVALCYAEFASSIPTSGSAYTYIYVSLGEIVAHLVGWSLILGYTLSTATVAGGWAAYFNSLLKEVGLDIPRKFTSIPSNGGIINLPAVLVVLLVTFLLSRGTKESKKINNIMVIIKLAIIILFVGVGVFYIKPQNWHPFMPFGVKGIFAGAASVFFAFTGFDAVSTSAEEVKNPQRNLPIGIISSLIICTIIYVIVCLVLTGVTHYSLLNVGDAMSYALSSAGQTWAASIISIGAVIGIIAVMLAYSYGASRILFSMSRDGLLPKSFSKVNKKKNVPVLSTWVVGIIGALMTGMVDLKQLADVANITLIGTFLLVALSLVIFRKSHPNVKRNFKVPLVPILPMFAASCCLFLMFNLSSATWLYFGIWLSLGTIIYFSYSRKHSLLNKESEPNDKFQKSA